MSEARLLFVCWGNICRSPMMEFVARHQIDERHLPIDAESVGVSAEELGNPIDRRARRVLQEHGYPVSGHRARKVSASQIDDATLVIAAEQYHLDRLRQLAPQATNLRLFSDFDPQATKGEPLEDPWYGPQQAFEDTLAAIERAMPNILDAVLDD